jgi:adenylate cyclase
VERRLTTVLSADVAGYSRLMGFDEDGTLGELKTRHDLFVAPLLDRHGGRLIKQMGDGFLAEFASVVNAVHFAVDVQAAADQRNAEVPEALQMRMRVGINRSDVIADQNDVYGDGVNVAARLQALSEPGGVCISETVYQHVNRHLSYNFEDLGKQRLRNISGAVQVYRLRPNAGGAQGARRKSGEGHEASIVVLPFANMSGDPEQEYFSDGITEDIITDLSKISSLFVVSRNTAFTFKGQHVDIDLVATRLGVQYVLEGSIRRSGDRVRITAQLIDGRTNGHVWAERYDRDMKDIFALQDDISRSIVAALRIRMLPSEAATLTQKVRGTPEAYRYYLMARGFFHRGHTKRYLRIAKHIFEKARDLDPGYAEAHAGIADCNSHLLDAGDSSISVDDIMEQSAKALALNPQLAEAHASKGLALYTAGRYEEAESCFITAIGLKPDLFEAYLFYGRNCLNRGRYEQAADLFGKAAELKNDDFRALGLQSMCYQSLNRMEDAQAAALAALARAEKAVAARPDDADALAFGAGLLAVLGETDRTKDWAERAVIIEPDDHYMHYNLACAFAILGEVELALDRLAQALGPRSVTSLKEYMLNDSDLDVLRDHPRYAAILKSLSE